MQNEEKTKRKSPYKEKQLLEQKEIQEMNETAIEITDDTLSHKLLLHGLKIPRRSSQNKSRRTLKNKIIRIFKIIAILFFIAFAMYHIIGYKIIYAMNPTFMVYKTQCAHIPLEEQGENCSILRARVLK